MIQNIREFVAEKGLKLGSVRITTSSESTGTLIMLGTRTADSASGIWHHYN